MCCEIMRSYYDSEAECSLVFSRLGKCWHLSTSENFEIIFCSEEDYKAGMGIMAICSRLSPKVKILTFELMSNHLHITAAAAEKEKLIALFDAVRKMLNKHFRAKGRTVNFESMTYIVNPLESLDRIRNVIAYDNRNGYLVSPDHTPFSYPWGANRYYFNSDARQLAIEHCQKMTFKEIRSISHSHKADRISDIKCFEGYALPIDFCDINTGEQLFRDSSHYFYQLSRNIENNKQIAKEIGESIFYTDNELFSIVSKISREKYGCSSLAEASPATKLELAKTMRYEYNSSAKQIMRFLKLSQGLLNSIGIK